MKDKIKSHTCNSRYILVYSLINLLMLSFFTVSSVIEGASFFYFIVDIISFITISISLYFTCKNKLEISGNLIVYSSVAILFYHIVVVSLIQDGYSDIYKTILIISINLFVFMLFIVDKRQLYIFYGFSIFILIINFIVWYELMFFEIVIPQVIFDFIINIVVLSGLFYVSFQLQSSIFTLTDDNSENDLKHCVSRSNEILQLMPNALFLFNNDGMYLDTFVPTGSSLLVSPKKFIGKNLRDILPEDLSEKFFKLFEKAKQTKKVQLFEYSLDIGSKKQYYEARIINAKEDRTLCIFFNITERKLLEIKQKEDNEDLIRMTNNAKELNATKDKLFSIIAHDLRNPFNNLLGLSEVLLQSHKTSTEDEREEIIQLLNDSAQRGYNLLENLLNWSRSQTGSIKYHPQNVSLKQIVSCNIEMLQGNVISKKIKLTSNIEDDITVWVDENMLSTILRNLVSNAIKFTPINGEIKIFADCAEKYVTLTISDNGVGIAAEDISKLFGTNDNFSTKGTSNESGTGLGLILCKEFVEKNGGKIWIESEINMGSDFKFTMPLKSTNV